MTTPRTLIGGTSVTTLSRDVVVRPQASVVAQRATAARTAHLTLSAGWRMVWWVSTTTGAGAAGVAGWAELTTHPTVRNWAVLTTALMLTTALHALAETWPRNAVSSGNTGGA